MVARLEDIKKWIDWAKEEGATHLIVVCDTWDWEDGPHLVMPGQKPRDYDPGGGCRIVECYAMHLDIASQLKEHRARHFELPPTEES